MTNKEQEIQFQIQRVFASLSRNILILMEDFKMLHQNNFNKLRANLPAEWEPVVDLSDYLDENSYSYYRKKFLDLTNTAKRDLEYLAAGPTNEK